MSLNFIPARAVASLMRRVDVGHDCWIWRGGRNPAGYGTTQFVGRSMGAHRAVYEIFRGPVPVGLVLDHLCRNPLCVNPSHLEAVTQSENIKRGRNPAITHERHQARTHCKNGHPFDQVNTIYEPRGRACRACRRIRTAAQNAKRRAK